MNNSAIIEKLLLEVDGDIQEVMTATFTTDEKGTPVKNYEVLRDAAETILKWQALRDSRK